MFVHGNFGKEKLDRAKGCAALVYEDNDANGIKTLIELENQYGMETIKKAADVISQKNPDNPRRTMAYLISTIRGMGQKETEAQDEARLLFE